MKKLIFILILLSTQLKAQMPFQKDTTPQYDFFIMLNDSNDFRRTERIIYFALKTDDNAKGLYWSEKMQDTVSGIYACEVPSPIRISKIKEISAILPYLQLIIDNPEQLQHYKGIIISIDIPEDWKWIISNLVIYNRKVLKIIK